MRVLVSWPSWACASIISITGWENESNKLALLFLSNYEKIQKVQVYVMFYDLLGWVNFVDAYILQKLCVLGNTNNH